MSRLTPFQTLALLWSSYLPLAYWIFPAIAIQYAKMDALWAILETIGVSFVMGWFHHWINQHFPKTNGYDIVIRVCGRWLGTFIGVIYVPCYLLFVALCSYFFASMMKNYFPTTPRAVFLLSFLLLSWRGAWTGVENLGRIASLVMPITLIGTLFSCISVIFYGEYRWIPLQIVNWHETSLGMVHLFPLYLGFNIFLMLNTHYEQMPIAKWYAYIPLVVSGLIVIMSFFAVLFNLGWFAPEHLLYPMQFTFGLLHLQGFIIERIGLIIIILATAYTVIFTSNHIWCQSVLIAKIFGQSEYDYPRFSIIVVAGILFITMRIKNGSQALWIYNHMLVPISWILLLGVPLLLMVVSLLRRIPTKT